MASLSRDVLLLCSASPRRAALLAAAGISFEQGPPPAIDETPPPSMPARDVALALARAKASRARELAPGRTVLCADTTVILSASILDKPCDEGDARRMLRALSGREHEVVTGVALARAHALVAASDVARVTFRALSTEEIDAYVASGEPFGKAGGYAIQGGAAALSARVDGDLETVVGLPTRVVRRLLGELDEGDDRAPASRSR